MRAYSDAMLRYFDLFGRSSRSQYWLFQLMHLLAIVAAVVVDVYASEYVRAYPKGILTIFALVIHIVPQITVSVRRLHDIGRSGFWYLLVFVPFGAFVLLYWSCVGSDLGPNDYGNDPRDAPPPPPRTTRSDEPDFIRVTRSTDYASETIARMQSRRGAPRNQFSGQ